MPFKVFEKFGFVSGLPPVWHTKFYCIIFVEPLRSKIYLPDDKIISHCVGLANTGPR